MAVKAGCGGSFDGICCRMVIETKRVFDGCAFNDDNISLTLATESPIPVGSEFVSARIVSSELVSYSVTDGSGGCCRVSGELVSRFAVTYAHDGGCFTVGATHRQQREVLLKLPIPALVPYSIDVQAVMNATSGTIVSPSAVSVSGCLLQIIKVTAPVDILIPTYGYCKYPPCTGCACQGFADADIFPVARE